MSFDNHFPTKEALIEAVLTDTVTAQGTEIDALTAHLDDPAEIISAAHSSFVRRARDDPDWSWLLVRLDVSHNILHAALGPYSDSSAFPAMKRRRSRGARCRRRPDGRRKSSAARSSMSMKRQKDRRAAGGQEAPMVITPEMVAQLIRQIVMGAAGLRTRRAGADAIASRPRWPTAIGSRASCTQR
jgi:AcrR family transcriptional regulator